MGRRKINLAGVRFNRLKVVSEAEKPNDKVSGAYWLCVCDCGNELIARGANLRHGSPKSCGCQNKEISSDFMKSMSLDKHGTLEQRFLSRFSKSANGCWIWSAHKDKDGYGILPANGPATRAHRYSIEYYKGINPKGFVVCHSCDNPSCVNPDHLFLGMPIDNVGDMLQKQRDKMVGSRNNKAKLNEKEAMDIYLSKLSTSALIDKYSISKTTINRIKAKKLWRHIHGNT